MLSLLTRSLETIGYDLSYYEELPAQSHFDCLYDNGYRFAIFEAQIGSKYSPYAVDQYKRAKSSGIKYIDFYIFPTTSKDPYDQVQSTISKLQDAGVLNGNMVWLDVENHDLFYSSCSDNEWYIGQLLKGMVDKLGKSRVGIYTNWTQWNDIMCGSTSFSSYQLWYPHYDNWQSFDDFKKFGGWKSPNIKQFSGDQNICSINGID